MFMLEYLEQMVSWNENFQVQLIEVPSYGRHFCYQDEVTLLIACVSSVSNQGRVGCQEIDDI